MSFEKDLDRGKEYELEVKDILEKIFSCTLRQVNKAEDTEIYKYVDIIEENKKGVKKKDFHQLLKFECKYTGDQHKDSPNVLIEYQTYRNEPSGIATSLADYWVFRTGDFHTIVKRCELVRAILYDLGQNKSHKKIKMRKMDHKRVMIVPIEMLLDKDLCPSTIRQLTRKAILGED